MLNVTASHLRDVVVPGKCREDPTMNQNSRTLPVAFLMTLLGGATLGGLAVAFTTTRTGQRWRHSLRTLAHRIHPGAIRPDLCDLTAPEPVEAVFI
jgi:hypothetical protein